MVIVIVVIGSTDLERTQERIVNTHHRTSIIELQLKSISQTEPPGVTAIGLPLHSSWELKKA